MTMILDGTNGVTFPDASVQPKAAFPGNYVTSALGADVNLSNTGLYFDGPSITLGTGTWLVTGKVTVQDPTANSGFFAKLWDGTTVYDSGVNTQPGSTNYVPIAVMGIVVNPVGPVKISVKGVTGASGKILFNASGNSKDSSITAVRIG